jgi:hypothetical protein
MFLATTSLTLILEMPGESKFITEYTYCINKAILCSGNNGVDHSSEVLNSFDGQSKVQKPFNIGFLRR